MPTDTDFWRNLIGFQIAWWACALFGNMGAFLALAWLLVHLACHQRPINELTIVLVCGGIGCLVDLVLLKSGWLRFAITGWGLPFWLLVLWGCFAATLNNAMRFLQDKLALAAIIGAVAGPLSYYAGAQFGRLAFPYTQPSLMMLACIWAILLPSQLYLAGRLSALWGCPGATERNRQI